MRTKSASSTAVAPLFVIVALLLFAAPAPAGDPVPGIEISLEEIPSGKTTSTTPDANGNFAFDKLQVGSYVLRHRVSRQLGKGASAEAHYGSHCHTGLIVPSTDGKVQAHVVVICVGEQQVAGVDPGTRIAIQAPGPGRIAGRVSKARLDSSRQIAQGKAVRISGQLTVRSGATGAEKARVKSFKGACILLRDETGIVARATADDAGNFAVDGVPLRAKMLVGVLMTSDLPADASKRTGQSDPEPLPLFKYEYL